MSGKALGMLRNSLDALMNMDRELACTVCASDDEVDAINSETYAKTAEAIRRSPEHTEVFQNYLSASRHLERIADYATNIAEDLIYMIDGEIVRHKGAAAVAGGDKGDRDEK
jgi:phosphate transport system protein